MFDLRFSRHPARDAAIVVVLASCGACSWALNWDKTSCSSSAECEALGADFEGTTCVGGRCRWEAGGDAGAGGAAGAAGASDGPWSCVGAADESVRVAAGEATIAGRVRSFKAVAVAGASVRACVLLDIACSAPVAGPALTDEAGTFTLAVPSSFSGYLEVTAEGYVPGLLTPIVADADGQIGEFDLLETTLAAQIVEYTSAALGREGELASIAAIYARALDCTGAMTAGVSFRLEAPGESELVYFKNDSLDFAATQTGAKGGALFLFVNPGLNAVVANRVEGDVEVDRLGIVTRPGHLTTAVMGPAHRSF